MQHRVYCRQIHSVDELKWWLIGVWCGLEQSIFDEAILTSGEEDIERVSTLQEDILSMACELTMLILFVHICYIQCDLFDCYIFNYEIMPATLANTFLFILQGSAH